MSQPMEKKTYYIKKFRKENKFQKVKNIFFLKSHIPKVLIISTFFFQIMYSEIPNYFEQFFKVLWTPKF